MLFVDESMLIRACDKQGEQFIKDFNKSKGLRPSTFLIPKDWDEFENYMVDKKTDELIFLEYTTL